MNKALLQPHWLGKYEVTQAEYEAIAGENPSPQKGTRLPVGNVSWSAAMAFCRLLTDREMAAGRLPDDYAIASPPKPNGNTPAVPAR